MAGSFTTYAEQKILLHSVAKTAWTMPTAVWLGLFFVAPTENETIPGADTTGTEVVGNGYARIKISDSVSGASVFGSITASGVLQNNGTANAGTAGLTSGGTGLITFAAATDDWISGAVVAAGIFDAATGGNLLWYGPFAKAKTVKAGDLIEFPANAIQLYLT